MLLGITFALLLLSTFLVYYFVGIKEAFGTFLILLFLFALPVFIYLYSL